MSAGWAGAGGFNPFAATGDAVDQDVEEAAEAGTEYKKQPGFDGRVDVEIEAIGFKH